MMNEEVKVQVGSDNVFADLDLPNPDERLLKAELTRKISDIIHQKNLTQVEAAEILSIDQLKVSALTRGRLSSFSITKLFYFLNNLKTIVEE